MTDLIIERAKKALNSQDPDAWQDYVRDNGEAESRTVLIKIAADKMRVKGLGGSLASVAVDCLLNCVNPLDADVIFKLRSLRGK